MPPMPVASVAPSASIPGITSPEPGSGTFSIHCQEAGFAALPSSPECGDTCFLGQVVNNFPRAMDSVIPALFREAGLQCHKETLGIAREE